MMAHPAVPATAEMHRHALAVQHERFGGWALLVRRDDFTGQVSCELRDHRMFRLKSAMVFQFPRTIDTFDASYRVDGAPAISWRVNAMSLASGGVQFSDSSLANPSGGRVMIPLEALAGAHMVLIRPTATARPTSFYLRDLPAALAAMRTAGCEQDTTARHAA
jgi:hypothetical protein